MEVPTNTMIIVTPKMNVLQIPILDEYSPLDRPHPVRAPVAATQTTSATSKNLRPDVDPVHSTLSRASSRLAQDQKDDAFHHLHLGDLEPATADESDERHTHSRSATSNGRHRSPAFALHAGFPPNGHIGASTSSAAALAAAAAAAESGSAVSPRKSVNSLTAAH